MTSSFGLSVTRDDVINAALRTIGKLGKTQTAGTIDKTNCSQALNLMIKAWMNKGFTLWKVIELVVPMIPQVLKYPLGPTAGYLATAGATITNAGSGGTNGTYALGIADAGGGTGATGTYTIAGNILTAIAITAAGSSYVNPVLSFPSGGLVGVTATITPIGLTTDRPLRVLDQGNFIRQTVTQLDSTVMMLGRSDYEMLGNKNPSGSIPNQFFFDPQLGNCQLFVYPPPGPTPATEIHLFVQSTIADTATAGALFDFPQEFMNALKWGLAREIMTEYGVDEATERRVEKMYGEYVTEAFAFSTEEASLYFTYEVRG